MFDNSQFFSGARGFYPLTIDQSLRFNDNDSAYLSRTPASAGNRKTWTWSGWVKRGSLGSDQGLFSGGTSDPITTIRFSGEGSASPDGLRVFHYAGAFQFDLTTTAQYRDLSAWYHIVVACDTTQATSTDRLKLYVNGVQVTAFDTATYPSSNYETMISNNVLQTVGTNGSGSNYLDGYLAEVHFTDGTAYDADAFGEFKSGVWVAKAPSVTYGTNGFYLDFANSADIGNDVSGNGNDWTPNNFTASDVVLDSPTDNFATLNPISRNGTNGAAVFSDGNLVVTRATGDNYQAMATIPVTSGKWYVELTGISATSLRGQFGFLVNDKSSRTTSNRAISQDGYAYRAADGQAYAFGVGSAYGATWTDGDVIGLALDADNGSATFYKNGVSQGVAFSGLTADNYLIGTSVEDGGKVQLNFGQLGFTYTPPTGYLALSTANLPDPVIDPAQDASPSDYFNTVLYTGTGTTRSVTGVGFQPDLLWTKARNNASNHGIVDAVRGTNKLLLTDVTDAEYTLAQIDSFDSDGFTTSSSGSSINFNGMTYVAWNWKANGSGVTNTDGSITSTVSANTTSGFSIVSYTGTGANATVGHGLDSAPEVIICKGRDTPFDWTSYWKPLGNTGRIRLNTTAAAQTGQTNWNSTTPTSSVFSLGTNADVNGSGSDIIAYCFHSVEGFSKFGSYVGNGSATGDGAFIYLGFRPKFFLVKSSTVATGWFIWDSETNTFNVMTKYLEANSSASEGTYTGVDFVSNGIKLRSTSSADGFNQSGQTYIYMAFAEDGGAFKYSVAR